MIFAYEGTGKRIPDRTSIFGAIWEAGAKKRTEC